MPKAQIYIHFPISQPTASKDTTSLLSGLGKATRRGIKKCYKCGQYNGTRGIVCKNKQCNAVFKDYCEKYKANLDSVKLMTGPSRQVYSVRVRDRGPNHRGFVQLPLESDNANKLSEVALCFVDTCQRQFDVSILKCHESEQSNASSICMHIESALKSCSVATPLELNLDVLKSLHVPQEIKERLWQLATETEGPIVQRVSKMVMAVKCQVTPKHPLGYLHFTMCSSKGKETYDKYYCSCNEFLRPTTDESNISKRKCTHYYACICALAGNDKLLDEFCHFINLELNLHHPISLQNREHSNPRKSLSKKQKVTKRKRYLKTRKPNNKTINLTGSWEFVDWLTSVTENLNIMFNQENENFKSIVYNIPEHFFILFKQRFKFDGIKTKLSDNCFKYIWYINETPTAKYIFDTNSISLQWPKSQVNKNLMALPNDNRRQCSKEPIIIIEWTPKVLNISKTGQLKLTINNKAHS